MDVKKSEDRNGPPRLTLDGPSRRFMSPAARSGDIAGGVSGEVIRKRGRNGDSGSVGEDGSGNDVEELLDILSYEDSEHR